MELQEAIEKRRSIRSYDAEKKVTKEEVLGLISSAVQAPSWKNTQTGRYDVVLSEEMKEEVLNNCLPAFNQKNAAGASALIVTSFVKDASGFDKEGGTATDEIANGWGMYDLGLQNENLVLSAKEKGFDTLIMGIRDAEKIRELLDIPENQKIGPVIALGVAADGPRPKERKEASEIARFF